MNQRVSDRHAREFSAPNFNISGQFAEHDRVIQGLALEVIDLRALLRRALALDDACHGCLRLAADDAGWDNDTIFAESLAALAITRDELSVPPARQPPAEQGSEPRSPGTAGHWMSRCAPSDAVAAASSTTPWSMECAGSVDERPTGFASIVQLRGHRPGPPCGRQPSREATNWHED